MKEIFLAILLLTLPAVSARAEKPVLLFIGSSTIEFWKSLPKDFPKYQTVNKGVGGTDYPFLIKSAKAWALEFPARAIVMYSGDNDLASGTTPEEIAANFRKAAEIVHAGQPRAQFFVISIKPSPSRMDKFEQLKSANRLIREESIRLGYINYIDIVPVMMGKDGKPRKEIFLPDMLHMKPEGYALWTKVVGQAITERESQERAAVKIEQAKQL